MANSVSARAPFAWCCWPVVVSLFALFGLFTASGGSPTAAPKRAQKVKRLTVPRLPGSVQVDGELDEPVWTRAAVLRSLRRNQDGGPEREPTELRVWYDDEALYLGWTCQDLSLQATMTRRDSELYKEEAVEFFASTKELGNYFEFEWNPLGAVFDAVVRNEMDGKGAMKSMRTDLSFTAKTLRSAAKVKRPSQDGKHPTQAWQVEVRLPFADLGQPAPKPGEVWRANFHRINRAKDLPVERLSWSPTRSPTFHQPNRFGYLEFGK